MQVIKRNGKIVEFDIEKIATAIKKAGCEEKQIPYLCSIIWEEFEGRSLPINIETIQDQVELALMQAQCFTVAQAYIRYREQHAQIRKPHVLTVPEDYVIEYPEMVAFCRLELEDQYWSAYELEIEKDVQDLRVGLSDSQLHGVLTVLRLFVQYEIRIGRDWWATRFPAIFKRVEFLRWSSVATMVEEAVHAPFYNRINEVLFQDTPEFHGSWREFPILAARMEYINQALNGEDDLLALAVFSIMEGAVLYSSFAFLKSFQSNGCNLLTNIVAGINMSIRNELTHSEVGAWCYNTLLAQSNLSPERFSDLHDKILRAAEDILDHEFEIIGMVHEKGDMPNSNAWDLKNFVIHRIYQKCLPALGIEFGALPTASACPVIGWFYDAEKGYIYHDFFSKLGRQYSRTWDEQGFEWE